MPNTVIVGGKFILANLIKILVGIAVVGLAVLFIIRWAVRAISPPPEELGAVEGRLAPCPDSPNCVSSQADDPVHQVEPLSYSGSLTEAKADLKQVIDSLPRTEVVTNRPDYIHITSRSFLFGFIDDTEFYFDESTQTIQVRAAARLGYSDFGVNRKRVQTIREAFKQS